jgi:glycosyltransferase involved in cell wall biosynthesis
VTLPVPVAFVMSSFDPGGTERQMIELARRLDPDRWAVHVACFRRRGGWFDRIAESARSIEVFPVRSFKSATLVKHMSAFARWCRSRRVAIVHTTDLPSNIFGLFPAACAGVPARIANRREINPDRSMGELALQRAAYSCANRIIANSRAAAGRLVMERVPRRKITTIPNGLETARFHARAPRARLRRVIVVANLRPEKGHDVLIDASPEILRRYPDAQFVLAGGGNQGESLAARANAHGVLAAFSFPGHCEDVASTLSDADIFVLPSRSDASPNAVIEAMAAGMPIVASNVGGIGELVDDGRTGLLVQPDAPDALADRICRLMADPPLGHRLGSAARSEALARHSFTRMVAAFDRVYTTELARRGIVPFTDPCSTIAERSTPVQAGELA